MPKKKKYVVTNHGRQRILERIGSFKRKDIYKIFDMAMKKGYSPKDLDKPLSTYLLSKCKRGTQVKLYNNMIFIYKYKNLITTYKLPDKYRKLIKYKELGDAYCDIYLHMKFPLLISCLIKVSSMFISMVEIGISVNLLLDDETFEKLVENYVKMCSIIKIIKMKSQYDVEDLTKYINEYENAEDVINESKATIERIKELFEKIEDKKKARKRIVTDVTILEIMVHKIRKNRFYLERDNKNKENGVN